MRGCIMMSGKTGMFVSFRLCVVHIESGKADDTADANFHQSAKRAGDYIFWGAGKRRRDSEDNPSGEK
jgi:hypothetical protein